MINSAAQASSGGAVPSRHLVVGLALAALVFIVAAFPAWSTDAGHYACVRDDAGRGVCVDAPAERIVTLSPSAAELVFAAGAGARIEGTVTYTDYPDAAADIPRVGNHARFDMERLAQIAPDLVVAWLSGNPREQVARVEALGLTVFYSEPRNFDDVATTLERLGQLLGTASTANAAADEFRGDIDALRARYEHATPVRVFYQIWDDPVMTVNDSHLIGEALNLCGGRNVFGELERPVPRLDRESVLAAAPEAIVAGGMAEDDTGWLDDWARFEQMPAVRNGHLYLVPPSLIQRPTPRLVQGTRILCEHLEQVRARR